VECPSGKQQNDNITACPVGSQEGSNSKQKVYKKRQTHGLAPFRICIPQKGKAYVIGTSSTGKVPLKESNQEIYNRIQQVKTRKAEKEDKRNLKLLKKRGKVCTLASFMFDV
jgi:hypothetical protein